MNGGGMVGKMNPNSQGHGLGWESSEQDGRRRVAHGGSLAGFSAMYARHPDFAAVVHAILALLKAILMLPGRALEHRGWTIANIRVHSLRQSRHAARRAACLPLGNFLSKTFLSPPRGTAPHACHPMTKSITTGGVRVISCPCSGQSPNV